MLIRVLALLAALFFLKETTFSATRVANEPTWLNVTTIRADFEELYQRLQKAHFDLYARRAKPDYDRLYQRMRKGFDRPLPLTEVRERFQRFVAFGRVAHARIDEAGLAYEQFRVNGGKAFPLGIQVVQGRAFVTTNFSGDSRIALGDELIKIDAQPMPALLSELWDGLSADNQYMRDTLMEHSFSALLWRSKGTRKFFRVMIVSAQGKQKTTRPKEIQISARSRAEAEAFSKLQAQQLLPDWNEREAHVLANAVGYLRPGPFYNTDENASNPWDNSSFLRFIEEAFAKFSTEKCTKLLIDLRNNPGGDNSFSDAMLAHLLERPFRFASRFNIRISQETIDSNAKRLADSEAGSISHQLARAYAANPLGTVINFPLPMAQPSKLRFQGQVIMLINRHYYSNTANVAALAQDSGVAKIVGEETSDLATTYGAMEQFTLSRSGIVVGYPKAQIVRLNGDLRARGVVPDVAIDTPIVQTNTDVVLEEALSLFAK